MKKILSIIIIGFLIGCSFGVQGIFFKQKFTELSETLNLDKIDLYFDKKTEIMQKLVNFPRFIHHLDKKSNDCGCNDEIIIYESIEINNKFPSYVDISNNDLPDYFNWRDLEGKDWTTPVKSQFMGTGSLPRRCGSCVVFAAMGALESVIKIREEDALLNPDLSEQYVLSCLPAAAYPYGKGCSGGNAQKIFECIISTNGDGNFHNGVPLESVFPYQAKDMSQGVTCDQKCTDWLDYLVPILDHGFIIVEGVLENTPESINTIKNMIMQHGPVMAGMETTLRYLIWGLTNQNSEDYLPYKERIWRNSVNHAVTIVGWKDDTSIPNGGYWICKNTIGSFFANDGFFNIEYGALFIGVAVVWADYDPASFDWPPNLPEISIPASGNPSQDLVFLQFPLMKGGYNFFTHIGLGNN